MNQDKPEDFELKLDDYRFLFPNTRKVDKSLFDILKLRKELNIEIKYIEHKPEISEELKKKLGL